MLSRREGYGVAQRSASLSAGRSDHITGGLFLDQQELISHGVFQKTARSIAEFVST